MDEVMNKFSGAGKYEGVSAIGAQMTTAQLLGGSSPAKMPPVWLAIDRLETVVTSAERELGELADRLNGVLTPQLKNGADGCAVAGQACPMEGRIINSCDRIEQLANTIRDLRQRLCI